ncbi:DinB family protein [Pontimicrobium aquaticum]|uniref:DinB family protein n=1 Tax=Pontimicrobium aquaticum TaxID=2565367 RepID=A0A4V5LR17_9FLAO|nr:DinB family protein [Pontimicrobium aquaticum]TJY37049.1 DinB family protein [Pontimicrobium aquaticum]
MKNILVFIIYSATLLFTSISVGQEKFNFSKHQIEVWKLAKTRTIVVAKAMPESTYNYRPTSTVISFAQQMVHISNSMLSMNSRFILGEDYMGNEKNASKMTKEEIILDLENAFDTVISTLKNMTDNELQKTGKRHGRFPLTKWQSFLFMRDHITNHRAKAVLYLRLNNISPPAYGFN